ncbi:RNA-directed DNA polymerase, eukaryota, reverse transcriptase zinc-binding domain protein, partial [Tanacetum coccineum]
MGFVMGLGLALLVWTRVFTNDIHVRHSTISVPVCSLLDSCTLDDGSSATQWNNMIPIKVNIFLWRLSLNKLPSRMNLDRKGIEVDSLLCPICHEDVETDNHTFFNCDLAKDLWALLARWWELDIPFARIFRSGSRG